jgi:hypothetical protein
MMVFDFFKPDYYRRMTDAVNDWWSSVYGPDDFYDRIELPLTVHICGTEIGFVQRELNYFTLGHEISHILDTYNENQATRVVYYLYPDVNRK